MNHFRTLRADEVDCRVATINEKGLSLLLYKDARCDMNILDETVGPYNWKREHRRENANCIVSLWDGQKEEWISKEDTGTESNTEAQKGLASDSFKRACFNWGIGRELYTAPFIWISKDKVEIYKNDKGRFACNDSFAVSEIEYDTDENISKISIVTTKQSTKQSKIVYEWQKGETVNTTHTEEPKTRQKAENPSNTPVCFDCGKALTNAEDYWSIKKYGVPLCREHQSQHKPINAK